MSIYLIRHTEVDVPKGTCYGQKDVPLKKNAEKDFVKLKRLLPKSYDTVYSSPSQRCTELAQFLDPNFKIEKALLELNFGDWEGVLWQDIPEQELKLWGENFVTEHPPKGENLLKLFERTSQFFDKLRMYDDQDIVIVAHAGVIRCMIAYMLQIPLENIFKIQVGFGKVYRFDLKDDSQMDQWLV